MELAFLRKKVIDEFYFYFPKKRILRPVFFMDNFDGAIGKITSAVLKAGLKKDTKIKSSKPRPSHPTDEPNIQQKAARSCGKRRWRRRKRCLLAGREPCAFAEGISLVGCLSVRGSTIGPGLHGGKRRLHDMSIERLGTLYVR